MVRLSGQAPASDPERKPATSSLPPATRTKYAAMDIRFDEIRNLCYNMAWKM